MESFVNDLEKMDHLAALHQANEEEMVGEARRQFSGGDAEFLRLLEQYRRSTPGEQGELLKTHGIDLQADHLALGVSGYTGRLLYQIARAMRAQRILELGSSSSTGLSTAWLAAALHDLGRGELIATEIVAGKIARLEHLLGELGLKEYVRIRAGDVFDTIARLEGTFDLVFLDVWARDYLALLQAVEPLCRPGTVLLADNMSTAGEELAPFVDYMEASPRWSSIILPVESGVLFGVAV